MIYNRKKFFVCTLVLLCAFILIPLTMPLTAEPECRGSINELLSHFKKKGIRGYYRAKIPRILGWEEAGSFYSVGKFFVEIFRFENTDRVSIFMDSGKKDANYTDGTFHLNGCYVLWIRNGSQNAKKIKASFLIFK